MNNHQLIDPDYKLPVIVRIVKCSEVAIVWWTDLVGEYFVVRKWAKWVTRQGHVNKYIITKGSHKNKFIPAHEVEVIGPALDSIHDGPEWPKLIRIVHARDDMWYSKSLGHIRAVEESTIKGCYQLYDRSDKLTKTWPVHIEDTEPVDLSWTSNSDRYAGLASDKVLQIGQRFNVQIQSASAEWYKPLIGKTCDVIVEPDGPSGNNGFVITSNNLRTGTNKEFPSIAHWLKFEHCVIIKPL